MYLVNLFAVTNDKGMTFVLPTPQAILHDNFCFLRVDGFYQAESDCGKYLRCHNSRGTLQKCPAGLFWQPAKNGKPGFCDWPRNVDCGTRPRPITTTTAPKTTARKPRTTASTTTTTTTTTIMTTTTKRTTAIAKPATDTKTICDRKGVGFFPDPTSCKNFVRCIDGMSEPIKLECPRDRYFNPIGFGRGTCDFPRNVCCFGRGKRDSCSPPGTNTKTICDRKGDGFFPDPTSCKNFVRCVNGMSKPIKLECPRGLYFSPIGFNRGTCDFPQNVCCFGRGKRDSCSPPPGRQ